MKRRWWIAGAALLLTGGVVVWTVRRAEVALEGARPAEGRVQWVPVEGGKAAGAEVWWAAEYVDAVVWEGSVWAASTSAVTEFGANREVRRVLRAGIELPGAVVTSLAVGGAEGTLWIGTRGAGLLEYDGRRIRQWAERGKRAEVTALLDGGAGTMLAGTGDGVWRIGGQAVLLHPDLGGKRVTALAGSRDSVWIGTEEALFYWQGGRLTRVEGTPGGAVLSLAAAEDQAWAGFAGGVIEVRGGKLERVVTEDLTATSLAVLEGELWIGTPEGAWRQTGARFAAGGAAGAVRRLIGIGGQVLAVMGGELQVLPSGERFGRESGARLADRNVSALAWDGGRLWVGFFDRGLQAGEDLRRDDEQMFCVNRIVAGPGGRMAVGTANGLALFEGLRQVGWHTKATGLMGDSVTDVLLDGEEVVVGTGAGITVLGSGDRREVYALQGLVNNHVYALRRWNGRVLAGTLGGLTAIRGDAVEESWTTANSRLRVNWITAVGSAGDRAFVGTYGGGMHELRAEGLERVEEVPRDLVVNPNAVVESAGAVYFGTLGGGIWRYRGGGWRRIVRGLPSSNVTALAFGAGKLYAGTDNGVAVYPEAGL